jgi:3-hydroxyisobutyrate dehydrogenase-like beta-hydroxyacid dehydrogenase
MPVIAVVAAGQMGAAVGGRLVQHGARVLTSLAGRSPASVARARAAGMADVGDAEIAGADLILSIVPPAEAETLAERLAPVLAQAPRKPLYVDCNAVSPATVLRIAAIVARTGCAFVDAGIIGPPPVAPSARTVFYASGEAAPGFASLEALGLDIRVLPRPVGAASALKMSYAGITKGLTAIGAAMLLAAGNAGLIDALAAELQESQPALSAWLGRMVPGMFAKAGRWTAEMQEIAAFADGEPAAIYRGMADFFELIARDAAGANTLVAALTESVHQLR